MEKVRAISMTFQYMNELYTHANENNQTMICNKCNQSQTKLNDVSIVNAYGSRTCKNCLDYQCQNLADVNQLYQLQLKTLSTIKKLVHLLENSGQVGWYLSDKEEEAAMVKDVKNMADMSDDEEEVKEVKLAEFEDYIKEVCEQYNHTYTEPIDFTQSQNKYMVVADFCQSFQEDELIVSLMKEIRQCFMDLDYPGLVEYSECCDE